MKTPPRELLRVDFSHVWLGSKAARSEAELLEWLTQQERGSDSMKVLTLTVYRSSTPSLVEGEK